MELVGRETEVGELERLIDPSALPASVLLIGDPGIGKTTLWRHGVARASARGFRVLSAAPVASETTMSYAAIGDLLGDVPGVEESLPPPQRHALRVALLLEDPIDTAANERALASALLNTFRGLAAKGPLLVAVDDIQWIDSSSAEALAFAVRRLGQSPVAVLLARRGAIRASPLEQALDSRLNVRVELGGLSTGALHRVLTTRLGSGLPRPVLHRVHDATGGNPFFALELARALTLHGKTLDPSEPLPVPAELGELVARRVAELPGSTVRLLSFAAAAADPTLELLGSAVGGDARERLDLAVKAGIIEIRRDRVRFAHPLYAAALDATLSPRARRIMHQRLGACVDGVEQRARHLALGAEAHDAAVATAVESAALRAAERGAPTSAAELFELASQLTPSVDGAARRRLRLLAAGHYDVAGADAKARALVAGLEFEATPGIERARVLFFLARLEADRRRSAELCEAALREGDGDRWFCGAVEHELGYARAFLGDMHAARRHLRSAIDLLAESAGVELCEAIGGLLLLDTFAGRPRSARLAEEGAALERRLAGPPFGHAPTRVEAMRLAFCGWPNEARLVLERDLRRAEEWGDEGTYEGALHQLAHLECMAGRFDRAAVLAAQYTGPCPWATDLQLGVVPDGARGGLPRATR